MTPSLAPTVHPPTQASGAENLLRLIFDPLSRLLREPAQLQIHDEARFRFRAIETAAPPRIQVIVVK